MKKPLSPEIQALIPDGIENFSPRCAVCTAAVPPKRSKSRSRTTCSPPCHAVLALHKRYLLTSSRCIACYHPANPSERAQFREWRKSQGMLRGKKGRPKKPAEPEAATFPPNPIDTNSQPE